MTITPVAPEIPLHLGSPEDFACVREFLAGAEFNDTTVCRELRIADMSELGSVAWDELPVANWPAALRWCIQVFLRGQPADERESRALCGEAVVDSLLRLGLLRATRKTAGRVVSPVWVYPVAGFVVASDRREDPEGDPFAASEDIVFPAIYAGTLRFLQLMPEAHGGDALDLCGAIDTTIQRLIEIVNAFPQIPLWLAFGAVLPAEWPPLSTYFAITLVLSLLSWTALARVVRGKILALREEDYAMAARLLGASHARILFRHLLPGFTSHIIVVLTMSVPAMILGETSLSFLGLGLRAPIVSWGVMLQDCLSIQTVANYPWLLMPVVLVVLTVLCFNFLGDGLRDAADPYANA